MALFDEGQARRRRRRRRPVDGMGDFSALVVGAEQMPAAELWRRGMAGLGAAPAAKRRTGVAAVVDRFAGTRLAEIETKIDNAGTALRVATGASLLAAVAALIALRRR